MKKEIRIFRTKDGKEPFIAWLESLKDVSGKAQIKNRLDRVVVGHYGDFEAVGEGVLELRIHYGPGYRVYFSERDNLILLLLLGGSKRTQNRDIKKAKEYLAEFRGRCYD